jgi:hypothetical protein
MVRMMRVGVAALALLVAADVASAQGGGGGGRGGRGGRGGAGQVPALLQNITLDAAVQAKVDALTAAFTEASTKLREEYGIMGGRGGGGGGTPPDSAKLAAYQAKNTELVTKLRADVKALLTPDQQKVWDTNLANLPPPGGRRGGGE